ncbi:MAG: molybdopterin converting factor subunit 1 [Anaerolineales bacterium]|jgi:molybdopterin synthase catalytic subunit
MTIEIKVLFFATLRERVGKDQITITLPEGTTVLELKDRLGQRIPELASSMASALISINREYAFDEEKIPEGAEVAIFPPVSGGTKDGGARPTTFAITNDELEINKLLEEITLPSTGAACIFTGMVRAITHRNEHFETIHLEYDAYKPMAEAKMLQVAEEIRDRWPAVEGIAIVQRIGLLHPGTPTVFIACTAAHRDTGVFEAARYGIDRLKEIVPIWKKEVGPEGQSWVEGSYTPSKDDRKQ